MNEPRPVATTGPRRPAPRAARFAHPPGPVAALLTFPRRSFILSALALSACGFQPVYRANSGAHVLRGAVLVRAPKNRSEFQLVRALETRLGTPSKQIFTLNFNLSLREESVITGPSSELQRFNIIGRVDYQMNDADGAEVTKGRVENFTAYSATGSTVSTDASQANARERLMEILSDQIMAQVLARFAQ